MRQTNVQVTVVRVELERGSERRSVGAPERIGLA